MYQTQMNDFLILVTLKEREKAKAKRTNEFRQKKRRPKKPLLGLKREVKSLVTAACNIPSTVEGVHKNEYQTNVWCEVISPKCC